MILSFYYPSINLKKFIVSSIYVVLFFIYYLKFDFFCCFSHHVIFNVTVGFAMWFVCLLKKIHVSLCS